MILPPSGEAFEWRTTRFGPALVCTPLERIAAHLFTTRAWAFGRAPDSVGSGWANVADALELPSEALIRMKQVHGRATLVVDQPDHPRTLERNQSVASPDGPAQADIAVVGARARGVAVLVADCVPLLIADRRLGVVAAAHAGWRGLALGVPRVAVGALVNAYGSQPRDLVVAVGPSVGACCYEVGPDVRQAFVTGGFSGEELDRWFGPVPKPTPGNRSLPGLPGRPRPGHGYFDGWAAARDQLLAAGVDEQAIFSTGLCTASHPEVLCSYRRDGAEAGRIAAAIRPSVRQDSEPITR